jgi:hypothetical protein
MVVNTEIPATEQAPSRSDRLPTPDRPTGQVLESEVSVEGDRPDVGRGTAEMHARGAGGAEAEEEIAQEPAAESPRLQPGE